MKLFITFEGGDGAGKSTQIRAVETYLARRNRSFLTTREPGADTSVGKWIRQALLDARSPALAPPAELFLYLADRAQHVAEIVTPALSAGDIVLCDRHADSTLAYQGYGRGIDIALLRRLNEMATGGLKPDLTFLLDCPVSIGLDRIAQRRKQVGTSEAEDRFEREKLEFHERVRAGFLELARAEPARFRVIDASQSEQEVADRIQRILGAEVL
jgi:dTMP kinase